MLYKTNHGYYQSTLLQTVPLLLHGFSVRSMGDLKKDPDKRARFFSSIGIPDSVVVSQQVHKSSVTFVHGTSISPIQGSDGLVTADHGKTLGVFSADCVPILAVDPKAQIIGAVHAGWRGTLLGIARMLISTMEEHGASSDRILVSMGPHIGVCCYTVSKPRANLFIKRWSDAGVAMSDGNGWKLNLARSNMLALLDAQVKVEHIDTQTPCTSCMNHEFFSYRKDTKATFGEMMAVIGFQ